jgi:hypothetical protein
MVTVTSRFVNIIEYISGATRRMHKSWLIITSIIIVCLALTSCIPIETKPHQVSVKTTQEGVSNSPA